MAPKIYNRNEERPPDGAVYIGRPSIWGNPFSVGKDGTREEVIELYRERLACLPGLKKRIRAELKGKDLVCWCTPLPCHGEVLIEIANNLEEPGE